MENIPVLARNEKIKAQQQNNNNKNPANRDNKRDITVILMSECLWSSLCLCLKLSVRFVFFFYLFVVVVALGFIFSFFSFSLLLFKIVHTYNMWMCFVYFSLIFIFSVKCRRLNHNAWTRNAHKHTQRECRTRVYVKIIIIQ